MLKRATRSSRSTAWVLRSQIVFAFLPWTRQVPFPSTLMCGKLRCAKWMQVWERPRASPPQSTGKWGGCGEIGMVSMLDGRTRSSLLQTSQSSKSCAQRRWETPTLKQRPRRQKSASRPQKKQSKSRMKQSQRRTRKVRVRQFSRGLTEGQKNLSPRLSRRRTLLALPNSLPIRKRARSFQLEQRNCMRRYMVPTTRARTPRPRPSSNPRPPDSTQKVRGNPTS
mmetsp:Transcript_57345/g.48465  ORF Transcript_57345/g.48465 Transcript_57345/m.48465 type:complete len:224 (+) Transcript_57345:402-1073(+)